MDCKKRVEVAERAYKPSLSVLREADRLANECGDEVGRATDTVNEQRRVVKPFVAES